MDKKRVAFSLFSIFGTLAILAGSTAAVFSDTASFEGNTVSTADSEVNIDARSEPGTNPARMEKPLDVDGLTPGEFSDWARGIVFNEADSEPVEVYMYVTNVEGEACPKINLDVRTGHAADGANSEQEHVVYSGALSGITGEENKQEITGFVFPLLPPNTSAVLQQRVQLDASATEEHQGSCTWDEIFVAQMPAAEE